LRYSANPNYKNPKVFIETKEVYFTGFPFLERETVNHVARNNEVENPEPQPEKKRGKCIVGGFDHHEKKKNLSNASCTGACLYDEHAEFTTGKTYQEA